MRPASLLWLFSSVVLLANAVPIPAETSELTNIDDGDVFDVDPAGADRHDLDETVDVEKRTKSAGTKKTQEPKPPAKQEPKPPAKQEPKPPAKQEEKPSAKSPGKTPPVKTPPGKTPASCPVKKGGKGKRAEGSFTSADAPASITIKLDGKEFSLTKFGEQGKSGATYQVKATGDFAKTPFKGTIEKEASVTKLADQLVASGRDENECNEIQAEWLITKKSPGKPLKDTEKFKADAKDKDKCLEVIANAKTTAKAALKKFHDETGFNHGDINAGNILFNDEVTEAFLIDFGQAKKGALQGDVFTNGALGVAFSDSLCPK